MSLHVGRFWIGHMFRYTSGAFWAYIFGQTNTRSIYPSACLEERLPYLRSLSSDYGTTFEWGWFSVLEDKRASIQVPSGRFTSINKRHLKRHILIHCFKMRPARFEEFPIFVYLLPAQPKNIKIVLFTKFCYCTKNYAGRNLHARQVAICRRRPCKKEKKIGVGPHYPPHPTLYNKPATATASNELLVYPLSFARGLFLDLFLLSPSPHFLVMPPARHPRSPPHSPTDNGARCALVKEGGGGFFFSSTLSRVPRMFLCSASASAVATCDIKCQFRGVFQKEEKKSQPQQRPIYENWVLLRVRAPCILREKRNDLRESSSRYGKNWREGTKSLSSTVGRN